MRICERCGVQMLEGFSSGSHGIRLTRDGLLDRTPVAELKYAVCPQCGKVEAYVEELDRIKELAEKNG